MAARGKALFTSSEISPSMIFHHLDRFHFSILLDPLSSTSGGTGYFKLQNLRVISNDLAEHVYLKGKALWENNNFYIPGDAIESVCSDADVNFDSLKRFEALDYPQLTKEQKGYLEIWHNRINLEEDEYIRALLCTGVFRCIDYWITMHQHKWEMSFEPNALLKYYLNHVNRQVINNRESNEMWRENPRELVGKVLADALYLNPPALKGYAGMGVAERISECWIRGDAGFDIATIAPEGSLGSAFKDTSSYMDALSDFLSEATHIQLWIITISNKQPFTQVELETIIRRLGKSVNLTDIQVPEGFFSPRAVHSMLLATG